MYSSANYWSLAMYFMIRQYNSTQMIKIYKTSLYNNIIANSEGPLFRNPIRIFCFVTPKSDWNAGIR